MGNDVIRAGRAINSRRRPFRIATVSAAALALVLATALTLFNYNGTAQAAVPAEDPCVDGAYVVKYPKECGVEFPDPETVTSISTETTRVLVPTTETVTTSVLVPTTETVTTSVLVPTTETVTTSVMVPTTQAETTAVPTTVTADPTTVTAPTNDTATTTLTEAVTNFRTITESATETDRVTVTDRTTERVTDTVAPIWWNAPSINPQTGQRPGVSLSATQVQPGDSLTVRGIGGTPGEEVRIVLHSDPIQIGTATVDSNGTFEKVVVIPLDTIPGQHTIDVVGVSCGVTTSVPLTVVAGPAAAAFDDQDGAVRPVSANGTLSYTGVDATFSLILGIALLVMGGVLTLAFRRRPAAGKHRY